MNLLHEFKKGKRLDHRIGDRDHRLYRIRARKKRQRLARLCEELERTVDALNEDEDESTDSVSNEAMVSSDDLEMDESETGAALSNTGKDSQARGSGIVKARFLPKKKRAEKPRKKESGEVSLRKYRDYAKSSLVSMIFFAFQRWNRLYLPLGFASYLYSMIPYARDVKKALVEDKKINADVLFFSADMLTIFSGHYFTAAFGLWLIHSGKMSVKKALDHSGKMITDTFQQLPHKVWVLIDGVEIERPLDQVKAGDIVLAAAGEVISVDGLITEGMASIDQRALTGESQPAEKGVGDQVFANTTIISGQIRIRVKKSGEETTAAAINKMLIQSVGFKSKVQLKGEAWADTATKPMLIAGGLMLPFTGPMTTAVFLNSHIGSRIRLLAPMATLKHITVGAKNGILVKDGRALEGLVDIDTVLFDKTGTLTTDEPEVSEIVSFRGFEAREVLQYAAIAETKLNHPIARAILAEAEETGLTVPKVPVSQYKIGYGITLDFEGKTIRVGSLRFIAGEDVVLPKTVQRAVKKAHEIGKMFILVAVDQRVAGAIVLQPNVRPEVKALIQALRARGVDHLAIVSGDHREPTQRLAEELGMDEFFYDVLPGEKANIVSQLQAKGRKVCFIGDGINDAVAMQQADVSVSLAGASTLATDVAEIILMDGDLTKLDLLFYLSERLDKSLKRSLAFTVAPGVTNIAGAFIFHFNILTSLLVNTVFGSVALYDVLKPFEAPEDLTKGLVGSPDPDLEPGQTISPLDILKKNEPASSPLSKKKAQTKRPSSDAMKVIRTSSGRKS